MTRLEEIEARLSEIAKAIDGPEADLDALDKEIDALQEEKRKIGEEAEQRRAMREKMAGSPAENDIQERMENDMEEKKTFAVDTEEYRVAWIKKLQGKELEAEERAAMTASAAIPTTTVDKIFAALAEATPMLSQVTMMNIPGNVELPYESAVADANWLPMANTATDAADAIAAVTLSAYKLIKTVSIGADVARISIDAFESWLVRRLVDKMKKAVDNAIINGTNSNQPKGFAAETYDTVTTTAPQVNLVKVASNASIGWDSVMDLIALLPSVYDNNAKFVMEDAVRRGREGEGQHRRHSPVRAGRGERLRGPHHGLSGHR